MPGALVTYMDSHEGFFVGAFTGCLFFATVLLWRVTNDTLKHAERTAERQLRAYVLTEGGAIKLLQEELAFDGRRAHVEFHIRVKNFGQTPAYNLTNWMFIDVFDWDYTGPFTAAPPPDQRPSSSPLGPGNGTFLNDWRTISPKSFAGIKDGTKAIFIWGEVNYVDAFGNERFVKFRMGNGRPTSAAAGEPERPGWPLFPHKEGNDAN